MEDTMLVVGLGNPGAEYENTYHNVGALAVASIAAGNDGDIAWQSYRRLFRAAPNGNLIFIRPLTFMNESGRAVREAMRAFAVTPENVILVHDDSDLPIGTWKWSYGRGAAGHHGVESVIASIGTDRFGRVRIGIRPPREHVREKAETFVLKNISKTSMRNFEGLFREIADALNNRGSIGNHRP
jgi:PTH1 family peptidyl-tRNA hydrolase